MSTPDVSVCMLAYNHEQCIAQAIEGVLIQKVDFSLELVIGEDCSSDRTLKIAQAYATRYPGVIRLLSTTHNLGPYANGHRTLRECRGKFLAFCEGDDYWTDPFKLAKQMACFAKHPDVRICCHNVNICHGQNRDGMYPYYVESRLERPGEIHDRKPAPFCNVNRLLRGNFIHTPSVVMKNIFRNGLPDWFLGLTQGDWPLYILAVGEGRIAYLDEVMSVYRIHSGGVWSSVGLERRSDNVIKTAYSIRDNLDLSFIQRLILNTYICNMHLYSAQRLLVAKKRWAALSRVMSMFGDRGNMHPAYILAFGYAIIRRIMPHCLLDWVFRFRKTFSHQ